MLDMTTLMDNETEKALAACGTGIIEAHIVYKDDKSELDVYIGVGISPDDTNDDEMFYYADSINELRSLLKGAHNWEHNNEDFYITSFSKDDVKWVAK